MTYMEEEDRYQKALLWPAIGSDGYGNPLLDTREELDVRWEHRSGETLDANGQTIGYDCRLHTTRANVPVGSIVWEGGVDDIPAGLTNPAGSFYLVQARKEAVDLKGRVTRRLLMLTRHSDRLPNTVASVDRALLFNSSTPDYLEGTGTTYAELPFSMVVWFKAAASQAHNLFGVGEQSTGNNYFNIAVTAFGIGRLEAKSTGSQWAFNQGSGLNDGNWHMLIAVLTSASLRTLYVDGSAQTLSGSAYIDVAIGTANLVTVGRAPYTTTNPANGTIDEPMIFSGKALNADDIDALYDNRYTATQLIEETASLPSGAKPWHAWPLSKNTPNGPYVDIGRSTLATYDDYITLTATGSPTDAAGI